MGQETKDFCKTDDIYVSNQATGYKPVIKTDISCSENQHTLKSTAGVIVINR